MKSIAKCIVMAIVALLIVTPAKSQDKEVSVKLSEPSKPGKLNIDLFNGSIKVVGYSGREVMISADGPYNPGKGDQKPVKDNSRDITDYLSQQSNEVRIKVDKPSIMNLVIKTPRNFSLVLKVVTAGNITVENVNGDHEIAVVNGNITLTGINSSVLANNTKGDIKVSLSSLKPNAAIALSSVVSTVELTAPLNLAANVRLQSDFGAIKSDFAIEEGAFNEKPKSMTHRVTGKINGGGADIYIKSVGSDIQLNKK